MASTIAVPADAGRSGVTVVKEGPLRLRPPQVLPLDRPALQYESLWAFNLPDYRVRSAGPCSEKIGRELQRFVLCVIANKHEARAVGLRLPFRNRLIGVEDSILHGFRLVRSGEAAWPIQIRAQPKFHCQPSQAVATVFQRLPHLRPVSRLIAVWPS